MIVILKCVHFSDKGRETMAIFTFVFGGGNIHISMHVLLTNDCDMCVHFLTRGVKLWQYSPFFLALRGGGNIHIIIVHVLLTKNCDMCVHLSDKGRETMAIFTFVFADKGWWQYSPLFLPIRDGGNIHIIIVHVLPTNNCDI